MAEFSRWAVQAVLVAAQQRAVAAGSPLVTTGDLLNEAFRKSRVGQDQLGGVRAAECGSTKERPTQPGDAGESPDGFEAQAVAREVIAVGGQTGNGAVAWSATALDALVGALRTAKATGVNTVGETELLLGILGVQPSDAQARLMKANIDITAATKKHRVE